MSPTSGVPSWLKEARTLRALARAFQWPLADFVAINPEVAGPDAPIGEPARVRVPDPRWHPMLAAYFASLVVRAAGFSQAERVRLLLKLAARAAGHVTACDTVLARLLLALRPVEQGVLDEIARSLSLYQPADPLASKGTPPSYPVV
ncbi:MAG: hypothetical protein ACRD15_18070 [Vicinamibacterales bacterium]